MWNLDHSVVTGKAATHFERLEFQCMWVPAFKASNIYNIHRKLYWLFILKCIAVKLLCTEYFCYKGGGTWTTLLLRWRKGFVWLHVKVFESSCRSLICARQSPKSPWQSKHLLYVLPCEKMGVSFIPAWDRATDGANVPFNLRWRDTWLSVEEFLEMLHLGSAASGSCRSHSRTKQIQGQDNMWVSAQCSQKHLHRAAQGWRMLNFILTAQ